MPLYEYECGACGLRFEIIQKFSDAPASVCMKCGQGPVHKLLSAPAFQFKGTGWYVTDYARKGENPQTGQPASAASGSSKSSDKAGSSGSSDKSGSSEKSGSSDSSSSSGSSDKSSSSDNSSSSDKSGSSGSSDRSSSSGSSDKSSSSSTSGGN